MLFSRFFTSTLLLVCAIAFSGCSSKESSDTKTVYGQAIKGLIANGSVSAYQVSSVDQSLTLLTTSQTDTNGSFSLEFESDVFKGPTLIQINALPDTSMVCELVEGCSNEINGNWYDYGEASPLAVEFQLLGLTVRADDGTYQANVSALSHLIVSTALNLPGGLNSHNIEQASAWVQEAFNLKTSPLKTTLTDITKLASYTSLNEDSLIQSILGASFYSLSQTQNWYEGKVSVHDIQQSDIYALASNLTSALTQSLSTSDAQHLSQISNTHFTASTNALEIITQPKQTETREGESFYFRVYAVSPTPITYQWLLDGNEIPNATSAVFGLSHATQQNTGAYSVRITSGNSSFTSDTASLSVTENTNVFISTQPAPTTLVSGQTLNLHIDIDNSANANVSWQKDGSLLLGQTSETLQIGSAKVSDSGNYRAVVEHAGNILYSDFARVTVTDGLAPITIQAQPQTQDILEGSQASLSISANGGGYLSYQWYKNGTALVDGTQALLSLGSANQSLEGNYHVQISNSVGVKTSQTAQLRIISQSTELNLDEQPSSASIYQGYDYTLKVSSPFATHHQYQWFRNGTALTGATLNEYTITAASEQDAGQYHAIVTNVLGTITSDSAVIDVLPLPSLALSWAMPSERENGEALSPAEIFGYKLAYGYTADEPSYQHDIIGAYNTQFTLQGLKPGTVFLNIATIDSDGVTGRFSSPIEVQLP